jgi:hypothetical protein
VLLATSQLTSVCGFFLQDNVLGRLLRLALVISVAAKGADDSQTGQLAKDGWWATFVPVWLMFGLQGVHLGARLCRLRTQREREMGGGATGDEDERPRDTASQIVGQVMLLLPVLVLFLLLTIRLNGGLVGTSFAVVLTPILVVFGLVFCLICCCVCLVRPEMQGMPGHGADEEGGQDDEEAQTRAGAGAGVGSQGGEASSGPTIVLGGDGGDQGQGGQAGGAGSANV